MKSIVYVYSSDGHEGRKANQYYIPILNEQGHVYPIEKFRGPTRRFIEYAKKHPDIQFKLNRIGCGATYDDFDVAPFFVDAPVNVQTPSGWREFFQDIGNKK